MCWSLPCRSCRGGRPIQMRWPNARRRFRYSSESRLIPHFGRSPATRARFMRSAKARPCGNARGERPVLPHSPSGIGYVPSPLVGVPSGTLKTYRSLLLAISSSTINKPSEYMILKIPPFCDHRVFGKTLQNSFNCQKDQDQIQDSAMVGTNCRLQNSYPAVHLERDLSVLRQIRCPLWNNLVQG